MRGFLAVSMALALAGCGDSNKPPDVVQAAPAVQLPAPPPPPPPAPTVAEWRDAVEGTFRKNRPTEEDGVFSYGACYAEFDGQSGKCLLTKFDGFKKGFQMQGASTAFSRIVPAIGLGSSLVMLDCNSPTLLMHPTFYGSKWLFMDKVAVMADGNVVWERDLERDAVQRDTEALAKVMVVERGSIAVADGDVETFRQMLKAEKLTIRISGEKGYVTVEKKQLREFKEDLELVLNAHGRLTEALQGKTASACRAS